jgi:D-threo-aldose 1-dehydrogenase
MISKQNIGQTGLNVSELGLGCASLAGIFAPVASSDARATINEAYEAGITYFDTAPFYGHGLSERLVGDCVRSKSDVVVSSKVGRLLKPGASEDPGAWVSALPFKPVFDYSYDAIMRSHQDSLQRMGLDRIDILYIHDIGNITHGVQVGLELFEVAMGEGYRALEELRSAGDIKAIGLGVNETDVCRQALERGDWDVFLLAGRYTLLEQSPLDDLFPACRNAGTDIVIGGPFNSGVLVGGKTFDYGLVPPEVAQRIIRLKAICDSHNIPSAAAALQFPLAHPIVKSVVPGPRTPTELSQILDWWNIDIPTSLWSDLQSEGLISVDAVFPG